MLAGPAEEDVDSAADLVAVVAVLVQRAVPVAREQLEPAHQAVEEASVEAEVLADLLSRQSFSAAMARSTT